MSMRRIRVLRAGLAGVIAMTLVGCTSIVGGVAVVATQPADGAGVVVALLDTGSYPTTAGHPVGAAGSQGAGAVLEAQRMAEYVVGPWEIHRDLRRPDFSATRAASDMTLLKDVLAQPILDVASAHGVITAFVTTRTSYDSEVPLALTNLVMRFPDVRAAAAAGAAMAVKNNQVGDTRRSPTAIDDQPDAIASAHDYLDGQTAIDSFTAHGPYVLYQGARSKKARTPGIPPRAEQLVSSALGRQKSLIDQLVATDTAKLIDLPLDPTGKLLARTLPTSATDAALLAGVWQSRGWLHFEDDPVEAAARYSAAGVEVVARGLTTVYQTDNARGAAGMVEREATNRVPSIKSITGVSGLPAARCFTRPKMSIEPTLHEVAARFRCIAAADRYAFVAYSATEKDVKQQIAAQYRILAGK